MDRCSEERKTLANEFLECRKVIIALGDETRQGIIMTLLTSDKVGLRVGEITEKTHLSRPAVSHHIQILKDAGIIAMLDEIIHHAADENYPDNHLGIGEE